MTNKYIIKITRKYENTDNTDIHYYNGLFSDNRIAYRVGRGNRMDINKFTKQETEKNVKEIKKMYKTNPENGTLLKIEVLNSETLEPLIMNEIKYTKFTRFEIMDI